VQTHREQEHCDKYSDEIVDEREMARQRVGARRDFASNAVAFAVVSAALVAVWAVTGAGYFWPAWVIVFWGVGILLHAWSAFGRRPLTEADIDAEMRRHHR
jgi:hypothetical protein